MRRALRRLLLACVIPAVGLAAPAVTRADSSSSCAGQVRETLANAGFTPAAIAAVSGTNAADVNKTIETSCDASGGTAADAFKAIVMVFGINPTGGPPA
jgi:hypothetical protein